MKKKLLLQQNQQLRSRFARLAIAPFVAIGCRRAAQCRLHAFHEARLDVQEVWVKDHPEIMGNL